MSSKIEVINMRITPLKISMSDRLSDIYSIRQLPIFPTSAVIEISGIHIPEINAIRRVLTDEIQHYYLTTAEATMDTDDPYITLSKIEKYISQIPLCYSIPKDIIKKLRLGIDIKNNTTSEMVVLCGDLVIQPFGEEGMVDLSNPIFDPTFELFSLSAGKRMIINDIQITTNYGKYNAVANLACNARYRFLDIEEYTMEEINKKENRIKSFVDQSGYKMSSLIANPIHHELSFTIPATSKNFMKEISQILNDVCDNIIYRLRNILMYIEKPSDSEIDNSEENIQSSILENNTGINRYICSIPNETHTIGNLLKWIIVNDIFPQCASVIYTITFDKNLELTINYAEGEDIYLQINDAVKYGINRFKEIKKQFAKSF